jgi:hypothetical protein
MLPGQGISISRVILIYHLKCAALEILKQQRRLLWWHRRLRIKPSQGSRLHQLYDPVRWANGLGRFRWGCKLDGPDDLGGRDVFDEVLWPLHLDELQHPDLPGFH